MLADAIESWAKTTPEATALQIKRDGEYVRITYGELWHRSIELARFLSRHGIERGDAIALYAGNNPEWVIAYLGIHLSGGVVVPLDEQYTSTEIAHLSGYAGAKALLTESRKLEEAQETRAAMGQDLPIFLIDAPLPDPAPEDPDTPHRPIPSPRDPADLMSIIFTSGTTGEPKGVELTTANISSNVYGILKAFKIESGDNILNILPLHHAYASTAGVFTPLYSGGTVTFCNSLKGPDLLAAMRETGVTIFPGVPQLFALFDKAIFGRVDAMGLTARMAFSALYALSRTVRKLTGWRIGGWLFGRVHKQFGPRLRLMASGGAKLDMEVAERLLNLGFVMLEGYGLTETAPVISFTLPSSPKPGSVGLPIEGTEVRIDSPDASGIGEICMQGPGLMRGYHLNPGATAEVIRDGWLHTGDLGYLDDEGMIHITGRQKDVIVLSSGKNIYPEDVEKPYIAMPLIKELCVMQGARKGGGADVLTAIVVPDMQQIASRHVIDIRTKIQSELAMTGAKLPSYMKITELVLYDGELPRTRLGKLRRPLIAQLAAELREAAPLAAPETSPQMLEMMEHPQSRRLLERLGDITSATDPLHPSQDLATDLGVDSLTKVQIAVMMEEEFGMRISEDEMAEVRTVEDLLTRVQHSTLTGTANQRELTWKKRLSEPTDPPLDELFNLSRSWLKRLGIDIVAAALRLVMRIVFRVRTSGFGNIPTDRAAILCPNHQSYVDAVIIYAFLPSALRHKLLIVAHADVFNRPPLTWIVGMCRLILTGRAGNIYDSLKLSYSGLSRGMCLCIYPEGGRATGDDIGQPKPGAGILSCESGAPIVPICIHGADMTLSPRHPELRPCRITITVGEPIEPPEVRPDRNKMYDESMSRWLAAVRSMREKQLSAQG